VRITVDAHFRRGDIYQFQQFDGATARGGAAKTAMQRVDPSHDRQIGRRHRSGLIV
jgi:hypothetical protein